MVRKLILVLAVFFISNFSWAEEELTWNDALQKATENHPDLISAKEQIRQSKDASLITESTLWPQASASLSATRSKTGGSSKSDTTVYSYGLSGSQLIFDALKTVNNVRSSKENIKVSAQNFEYVSSVVRLRLRTAFINLLKAQNLLKLTQEIYDIRKQNLDLIELRYNSGMEHRGALLTAEANLAQADFEINQARRGLRVAQRNLMKEVGARKFEPVKAVGDFDNSKKYPNLPDLNALVENNPQLLRINAQINSASFSLKADQNDFWPAVSLVGGAGKSDDEWAPKTNNTNVGLRLTWSLIEGGAKTAQLDRSRSIVSDLLAQQQSLKDTLVVALEESWASLADAIEQVSVRQRFMDAAMERSKIAQQQYSVGLITFDNWTIIQDDLVSNKKTLLNTQANALLAEANWISAQGRTLEYEN